MTSTFFSSPQFETALWGQNWPERFDHPIEEYGILRESVGAVNFTGLEYVLVQGRDAGTLLQGLLTHDNLALKPGESSPSWMLDSNGKITAYLQVTCLPEGNGYAIQCLPGQSEALLKALDTYIFMEDARLSRQDSLATISLQGAEAKPLPHRDLKFQFASNRCGEPGWDLVFEEENRQAIEDSLTEAGMEPIGLTALNIRRVEEMVAWFEVDMHKGKMPLIYGKGRAVSYTKGCFLGQETIAMTRDRGRPAQLMVQLEGLGQDLPDPGTTLSLDKRNIGALSSTIFSPEFEAPLALATLPYTLAQVDQVVEDAGGQQWRIRRVADWM